MEEEDNNEVDNTAIENSSEENVMNEKIVVLAQQRKITWARIQ